MIRKLVIIAELSAASDDTVNGQVSLKKKRQLSFNMEHRTIKLHFGVPKQQTYTVQKFNR